MVILRSQNKIIDFLMILDWASPFLKIIFDQSLQTGKLPDDYVEASVAPIFKKHSPANASCTNLTTTEFGKQLLIGFNIF